MQKKFPIRISPNPLLTSTVEVRFQSSIHPTEALNFYIDLLRRDLPMVMDRPIHPVDKAINQSLEYTARYIFSNEVFSVYADHNVIAFGNVGEYQLWGEYFPFIKKVLDKLALTGKVDQVKRLGVRYASFLEYKGEELPILNLGIKFDVPGYQRRDEFFKTEFFEDQLHILFQLARYVSLERDGRQQDGVMIDIDVFCTEKIPSPLGQDLYYLIDQLHSTEKQLFFALLQPDYLASLNPVY